jgi:hypothetical protein
MVYKDIILIKKDKKPVLRIELRTPTLPMWYSYQLSYTGRSIRIIQN